MSNTFLFQAIKFNQTVLILKKNHFSISRVSQSKIVPFQTIQFSVSTQFKCKYSVCQKQLFQTLEFRQTVLFQRIKLSTRTFFIHSQLNVKAVQFQTIRFSISLQFNSILPIDRILSGATTPGQSVPGSNGNEGILHILQSSSIIGTSPPDCFVS